MIYSFGLKVMSGDAQTWCAPVRLGACGALVPVADIASIVCTARNLGTNGIVNSRSNQVVLNSNGGSYTDPSVGFTFFIVAADTALIGNALTTDRETHVFSFTITLDDGTIGTFELCVECLPRPAVTLNTAADLGRLIQRWRVLVNELDSAVPDSDWIYAALQDGAEATNGKLKYAYEDIEITLVAGTPDYPLPDNYLSTLWADWNGKELFLADQDQQRRRANWWLTQPQGPPEKYVIWQKRVIVIPTPDAASVTVEPTLLMRSFITPPPVRLNGFQQLPQEFWELPLIYSAGLWFYSPMGGNPAQGKAYLDLWAMRMADAQKTYAERLVT